MYVGLAGACCTENLVI